MLFNVGSVQKGDQCRFIHGTFNEKDIECVNNYEGENDNDQDEDSEGIEQDNEGRVSYDDDNDENGEPKEGNSIQSYDSIIKI